MDKLDLMLYMDEKNVEELYNFYFPNITEVILEKDRNRKKNLGIKMELSKYFPININTDTKIETSIIHGN